jgi:hypothetical protein
MVGFGFGKPQIERPLPGEEWKLNARNSISAIGQERPDEQPS